MKLGNLLIASAAAALSYWAVSNRQEIADEVEYKQGLLKDMSQSYSQIQQQIETLKEYQKPLQDMAQDLQYKLRVYQQEATAHMEEIQTIQEKYQENENKSSHLLK